MTVAQPHDSSECKCRDIEQWGPSTWYGGDINSAREYITSIGGYHIQSEAREVCRMHMWRISHLFSDRKCVMCSCSSNDVWNLMKLVVPDVDRHASIFRFMGHSDDVIDQDVDQCSWLCNCCAEIIKISDPFFSTIE